MDSRLYHCKQIHGTKQDEFSTIPLYHLLVNVEPQKSSSTPRELPNPMEVILTS